MLLIRWNWGSSIPETKTIHLFHKHLLSDWKRKWQPTPVFLGNPRNGGAWWLPSRVAQSRTRLKRLSNSSSSSSSIYWVFLMVKNLPAMHKIQVWSLSQEDPLEKGMATHSPILAWRIPWTEEPGELPSGELKRVGHDWATTTTTTTKTSLMAQMLKTLPVRQETWFNPWVRKIPWRREWKPIPEFLPGEFHGQKSLVGYSPWGHKESDMTEQLTLHFLFTFMGQAHF